MPERLTSLERIDRAMTFGPLDRVPVAPFIQHHVATATGISVRDFLFDFRKSKKACRQAFEIYGGVDMVTWFPGSGYLVHGGERILFGTNWVFKDGKPIQILEEKQWEVSDYDRLIEEGISTTMIRRPPEGILPYIKAALHYRSDIRYWERVRKVAPWAGSVAVMPFELLSWKRSLTPFLTDIFRYPDKILRASEFLADGLVEVARLSSLFTGLKRVFFDCNRASATFISPRIFKKLVLPPFKRMVRALVNDGHEILFHLDTDWAPMLPFFLELPRGRYIVELENTDIRKAKEILKGHMCIKGNVNSTLLRLGSPAEVTGEVRNLIDDLAPGGGFILGSGCEVPLDAPLENVQAMIGAVKKYGWY